MHSACLWQLWVFSLHGFSGSHTWMGNRNGWATNWISPLLFVSSGSSVRLGTKHVVHEILLNAPEYHPLLSYCCGPGNLQLPVITRGWTPVWMPFHELTEQKVTAGNRSLIKTVKPELFNSNETNPFSSNQFGKLGYGFKASCSWRNRKLGRPCGFDLMLHSNVTLKGAKCNHLQSHVYLQYLSFRCI